MDETRPRPRKYECAEGKEAARRFEGLVKTVMTTPSAKRQKPLRTERKKERQTAAVPTAL